MTRNVDARTPRFLSAAPRLQVEPAKFGGEPRTKQQPHLSVVDTPWQEEPPAPRAPAPLPNVQQPLQQEPPPAPAPAEPRVVVDPRPTEEMIARLASAVEALRLQSERLAATARSDALEIGFLVARRILETEIASSPEPLFALVRSAIRRAGETRTVGVRLHPADLALVEAKLADPIGGGLGVAEVKLIPDGTLSRGDCIVEAEFGTVDGRLSSRLAEMRRALGLPTEEE